MTVAGMKKWRNSRAFKQYAAYHDDQPWADETADQIWKRALKVVEGEASKGEREKVMSYISRHSEQEAGERKYGEGSSSVSAHTAALRNWGFDPTGRYT
jgi:hypothetical protein